MTEELMMAGDGKQEGAAMVEFALLLPVLVVLLFATIQFGLAFFEWQGLQAAAREGARLAAYSGAPQWSDIESRILDAAADIKGGAIAVDLDIGGSWVTPAAADLACDGLVDEVRVRVRYVDDYELSAIFFSTSVPMAAEAVFRCENAP